ncbi:MAG: hypothetical protein WD511_00755 [Balneolaceae bacterium]
MSIKQYGLIIGCTLTVATYQTIDPELNIHDCCVEDPQSIGCYEKVNYGSLSGSVLQNYEKEQYFYQMNAESLMSGSISGEIETNKNEVYFHYQSYDSFGYNNA